MAQLSIHTLWITRIRGLRRISVDRTAAESTPDGGEFDVEPPSSAEISAKESARVFAEARWSARSQLLRSIRDQIAPELLAPASLQPQTVGMTFAPVVDLAVEPESTYGWVTQGLADEWTPPERRLRRGTPIVFVSGEQEQCPGGPGENICHLRVEEDGAPGPTGEFTIPYDLRWSFGALLAEAVLAHADEPLLSDSARLDAIADAIRELIEAAPPIARG